MTCPHGMPKPETCMDCMEEGNLPVDRWKAIGHAFASQYPGTCKSCNGTFAPGEYITRWDLGDKQTSYTHWWCKL